MIKKYPMEVLLECGWVACFSLFQSVGIMTEKTRLLSASWCGSWGKLEISGGRRTKASGSWWKWRWMKGWEILEIYCCQIMNNFIHKKNNFETNTLVNWKPMKSANNGFNVLWAHYALERYQTTEPERLTEWLSWGKNCRS